MDDLNLENTLRQEILSAVPQQKAGSFAPFCSMRIWRCVWLVFVYGFVGFVVVFGTSLTK